MGEKIIYSKYANERGNRFAMRTDIVKTEDGQRVVRKRACDGKTNDHVLNIQRAYKLLHEQYAKSKFCFNKCRKIDEGLELEYIEGKTFEAIADEHLYAGDYDKVEELILSVVEELYRVDNTEKFQCTEEFVKVFGEVDLGDDLLCLPVTDIDIILSNIMTGERWNVIDYEWTFSFPIPIHFIVYRLLHYYIDTNPSRIILRERNLMEKVGVCEQEEAAYKKMERHFQNVYILTNIDGSKHVPIRDMYDSIAGGVMNVRLVYDEMLPLIENENERKEIALALINKKAQLGNALAENARLAQEAQALDEQLLLARSELSSTWSELSLTQEQLLLSQGQLSSMNHELQLTHEHLQASQGQNEQLQDTIAAMENTKIWKIYKKIKG